nr:hypothetical protein [Sinirhodobacter populi]
MNPQTVAKWRKRARENIAVPYVADRSGHAALTSFTRTFTRLFGKIPARRRKTVPSAKKMPVLPPLLGMKV